MSNRPGKGDAINDSLSQLGALAKRATGADPNVLEDVGPALDAFRRAVVASVPRQSEKHDPYLGSATINEVVGSNARRLREEADLTQARVADAMSHLGFDWKRITVTQVEAATRRLSLEELLCLAALFGVPALDVLLPTDDAAVELPEGRRQIYADTLRELVLGRGGRLGAGGPNWHPALELAGEVADSNDVRPAVALWERRKPERRRGRSDGRTKS